MESSIAHPDQIIYWNFLFRARVQRVTSQLIQKATYWCRSITPTGEVMPLFPFRATLFWQGSSFLHGCWQRTFLHQVMGQGESIKPYQILSNLFKTNFSLYLLHFFPNQRLLSFIAFITFPVALAKTAQALLQVFLSYWLNEIDGDIEISLSYRLSCCQGYIAAIQLVEIDRKERKESLNKE